MRCCVNEEPVNQGTCCGCHGSLSYTFAWPRPWVAPNNSTAHKGIFIGAFSATVFATKTGGGRDANAIETGRCRRETVEEEAQWAHMEEEGW